MLKLIHLLLYLNIISSSGPSNELSSSHWILTGSVALWSILCEMQYKCSHKRFTRTAPPDANHMWWPIHFVEQSQQQYLTTKTKDLLNRIPELINKNRRCETSDSECFLQVLHTNRISVTAYCVTWLRFCKPYERFIEGRLYCSSCNLIKFEILLYHFNLNVICLNVIIW